MEKKKDMKKYIALGLLGFVAVGSYFVGGTYAKYTSKAEGSSTGTVAKWAWKVDGTALTLTSSPATLSNSINLFSTINDSDGTTEADVASGKIAPGTTGSFSFKVTNASEVNAEYSVAFTETNTSNIPIEYCLGDASACASTTATWTTAANAKVEATGINIGKDATVNVQWRWAFEGINSTNYSSSQTDVTDTSLGTADTAPTVVVETTLTMTQVD